ncbi:MAG: molybdopterin-dependent oxidoreductase [Gammaproteobacteria bacterium]|nr:molybdopterin-dependent oxidoreductase [Gammaproteobacteria bacterium]
MKHNKNPNALLSVTKLDRRAFLKLTGYAGGGLMLGITVGCSPEEPSSAQSQPARADAFAPNAYVQITEEGITIYAPSPEIGQGVKTSFPMIVAEELDAAWEDVTVIQADIDAERYGRQAAGGSAGIPRAWMPLRQAGAVARHMLVAAAAARWEVDATELETLDSTVIHAATGRTLSYLELAREAADLPVPDVDDVTLKDRSQFRLLGKRIGGVDNTPLVTGAPLFGIDTRLPQLLYATYVKCPARGGEVESANIDAVKQLPGVVDAFVLEGNGNSRELLPGVAIVAVDTWSAFKARATLEVVWDESRAAKDSTSSTRARALELARTEGDDEIVDDGDVEDALAEGKQVSGFYEYAFVSHAQLEPQNTTAWWHDGIMELWAPTQSPQRAQSMVADLIDLDEDEVTVHQMRAGGGFGRRAINDVVAEAVVIAKRFDRPVKLTWKREDDMNFDFFRAGGFHALTGAVDADGRISAWRNHFISFTHGGGRPVIGGSIRSSIDPGPFVDNYRITQTLMPWQTPCGPWRAPGSNVIAFVHQCFLHELSTAAGRDHLEFLLDLMGEPRWLDEGNARALNTGRATAVIKLAAEKAGWGRALPDGRGLGLAFYFSHAAHIAEVAEVSVDADKRVTVERVTVGVDVGPIINLSGAENQVQGSVIDGLSTMLDQAVTFEQGRAQQTNFHQYSLLRMPRAPDVDAHFIISEFPPTGLGEPALPPLAPAVANAIFDATGERVRRLPISHAGWV